MLKLNLIKELNINKIRFNRFSTYSCFNKDWTSENIRNEFINYFENLNYQPIPSASLIPPTTDKSLLFINAGMVPLKQHFLNPSSAPYPNMVSVQRCVRAGGKDNDLEQVGFTKRHMTLFEMLGSFSFGSVDPTTKINQVWTFLTVNLGLDKSRLRVSVLEGDDETYKIWTAMGVPPNQIVYGPPKDNFWSMGDVEGTPCGPCTEIYYDTRVGKEDDEDRWLEIWNVVFMKYSRGPNNTLVPLTTSCIDTGMGLERLTSVLQDKDNAFDIDTMSKLIVKVKEILPAPPSDISAHQVQSYHRMVADHLRTCAFLIADGVLPSNVGRGYLLRRILRRATRVLKQLGSEKPLLSSLIPTLLSTFNESSYPHIHERSSSITHIIKQEEELFSKTLTKGLNLLNDYFINNPNKAINSQLAFQLYDTHGFPLDLVEAIAKEKDVKVDVDGFQKLVEKSKSISKASWKGVTSTKSQGPQFHELQKQRFEQTFVGYQSKESLQGIESRVIAIDDSNLEIDNSLWVILEPNPFYGYGGGQIPDQGSITLSDGSSVKVLDVQEAYEKVLALKLGNLSENYSLEIDDVIQCSIDPTHRKGLEIHHTATHLLNAALKKFVSKNVVQAGSLVEPKRLRFDFSHSQPLSSKEIQQIENWINQTIENDLRTSVKNQSYTEAIKDGAVATFTEKYPEIVRVIDIEGVSKELCGGTHSTSLAQIYPFLIVKESGIAANVRRIEAIAGSSASKLIFSYRDQLNSIAKSLKAEPDQINDQIYKLQKDYQSTNKLVEELHRQLASSKPIQSTQFSFSIDNNPVNIQIYTEDDQSNSEYLKARYNSIKNELESQPPTDNIHLLISYPNIMLFKPSNSLNSLHAGKVLKQLLSSKKIGNGGGSKDLAQGKLNRPLQFDE